MPRVFKNFNYRIIWADGSMQGQGLKGATQSSVLRTMAMGQMLATTHRQSYPAQFLWCERVSGLWMSPLITPHATRGFCHAVVRGSGGRSTLPLPGVIQCIVI